MHCINKKRIYPIYERKYNQSNMTRNTLLKEGKKVKHQQKLIKVWKKIDFNNHFKNRYHLRALKNIWLSLHTLGKLFAPLNETWEDKSFEYFSSDKKDDLWTLRKKFLLTTKRITFEHDDIKSHLGSCVRSFAQLPYYEKNNTYYENHNTYDGCDDFKCVRVR